MNDEAKQMCLDVLLGLLARKKLDGIRKTTKALGISSQKAKSLLNSELDEFTQDEIIKLTAVLIRYQEG